MGNKIKKIGLFGILPLLLVLLAVWGYCETAGSDYYNYQGYVIAIRESEEGTILTTLSGDKLAEYTVKWHSRGRYNKEIHVIQEGDFIMLSPVRYNPNNIKKFSVYDGFSMEGKIVYMDGLTSPFLLTTNTTTNTYSLYCLVSSQETTYPLQTGTQVKIYYQYPLNPSNKSVVADIIEPVSDILSPPTESEIAFITEQGYKLSTK